MTSLINASKAGKKLSQVSPASEPTASDAERYIRQQTDHSAFHLLMFLRSRYPRTCDSIPADIRAKVLCSALEKAEVLNDFGYLEPASDGVAGKELLSLGKAALPQLQKLLDDRGLAPIFGSEEAIDADVLEYRRCDYAYRYIMLILGKPPKFLDKAGERDKLIDDLRRELTAR